MPQVNGRFVPDMKSPRTPDNEEPAAERACDFRPVDKGFTKEMALAEAERCMDCKKPFCVDGCPVNINIPKFIEKIREEDWAGALSTIKADNLLPSVCGRVCPQENQCEGKCILGKKGDPVAIGQLERMLGDMADEVGDYQRQLFLMDHAGLPQKTVLEQIELLGTEVVPVLRKELDARRPADVPDAPTHASLVAAAEAERGSFDDEYRFETGDNWTGLRAEDSRSENRLG